MAVENRDARRVVAGGTGARVRKAAPDTFLESVALESLRRCARRSSRYARNTRVRRQRYNSYSPRSDQSFSPNLLLYPGSFHKDIRLHDSASVSLGWLLFAP